MTSQTPTLQHLPKKESSTARDWAAPILVWALCIGMFLAIVSVLLGPAR